VKIKTNRNHSIKLSEKELDTLQLAVALMIADPNSHPGWKKVLCPILKKMRAALKDGVLYEPVEGCC
jgi:hypothetical protein